MTAWGCGGRETGLISGHYFAGVDGTEAIDIFFRGQDVFDDLFTDFVWA